VTRKTTVAGITVVPGPVAAGPVDTVSAEGTEAVRRVAKGGILNLVGAVANGSLGFVLVVIVTNGFTQRIAGTFFTATAVFVILLAVVELGATTGLVRWIPAYLVHKRDGDARAVLRIAIVPVLGVSVCVAVIVAVVAPHIADVIVSDPRARPTFVVALRGLAIFLPIAALYDCLLAASRGYRAFKPTVIVERIGRSAATPLAAVAVLLAGGGAAALSVSWAAPYVIACCAAAGFLELEIRRRRQRQRQDESAVLLAPQPIRNIRAEFWRYTSARGVSRILQVALLRVDIVLVSMFLDERAVAIYAAATRLVTVGLLGVQAVQEVVQPILSRLHTINDREGMRHIFRISTAWVMSLTWPAYLTGAVLAPLLLRLFGPGYGAGEKPLIILALAMLVATGAGAVDVMLLMSGRSLLSLGNIAAALATDIIGNILLIPRWGIVGAAISWAFALMVSNGLALSQVRRIFGVTPLSAGTAWVAVSAIGCFGVLLPLIRLAKPDLPLLPTLGWLVWCVAVYGAALWVGRRQLGIEALRGVAGGSRRAHAADRSKHPS
jgi:O-antigen/teichoic acid export membrane protein